MAEKHRLPAGGTLYRVGETMVVVYEVQGIRLFYFVTPDVDITGLPVIQTTEKDFWSNPKTTVEGGQAAELFGNESIESWIDEQLIPFKAVDPTMIEDPEVRALIFDWIANPEMSEAEFQVRLRQTAWYQGQSTKAQEWSRATDAEKRFLIDEAAGQLAQTYFEMVGKPISMDDPTLHHFAVQVASGKMSRYGVFHEWVRPAAEKNPESPWSRQVRTEEETQRQRTVDIENKMTEVREAYRSWGIPVSESTVRLWAERLASNDASDEDLISTLEQQAAQMYPWKTPGVPTLEAARPWLETYSRTLERPIPDLLDPVVQQALTSGMAPWQFEQELKKRDEWLQTKNAHEDFLEVGAVASRLMGFN